MAAVAAFQAGLGRGLLLLRTGRQLPGAATRAVGARGLAAVLAFLSTLVLARALGPASYGPYALAVVVLGIASVVSGLGLDQLTARELSVYMHRRQWDRAVGYLRWARMAVGTSSVMVFIGGVGLLLWNPMAWPTAAVAASGVLLVGLPSQALIRLHRGAHQANDSTSRGIFFEQSLSNFLLLVGGLLILATPRYRTTEAASWIHVAALLVASVAIWISLNRMSVAAGTVASVPDRRWFRQGARFAVFSASGFLLQQADLLLVGTILSEKEVGIYSLANRSALLMLIVLGPVQQVLGPRLARCWADGDRPGASAIARRTSRLSLLACLPLLVVFLLAPRPFLALFGPGFEAAAWPLRILGLAQLLPLLVGPGLMVLIMIGAEGRATIIILVALLSGLAISYALLPSLGLVGAALGRMGALALTGTVAYFETKRRGLEIAPWG